MNYLLAIKKGKAVITANGVRCQGPRIKDPSLICNKLIARKNNKGQIAGEFKCDRCNQVIEIELSFRSN